MTNKRANPSPINHTSPKNEKLSLADRQAECFLQAHSPEEQFTVATASNPEAWAALQLPGVLPPGFELGPDPTPSMHNGIIDPAQHVELQGPAYLEATHGAKAAVVGTSCPACGHGEYGCSQLWRSGQLAETWHANVK